MEEVLNNLKNADLTLNEAKTYTTLLKFKELNANTLAKKTKIDRSLTYNILNKLLEKGLVNYKIKESKKYFTASKPENLLNNLKEKESIIKKIIPTLEKIQQTDENEYSINIYEGKAGLRSWINLILKEKEYLCFGITGKSYYELYEMPLIIKEIKKRKIKGRLIGYEKTDKTKKPFKLKFEYRFIDFKMSATTSIFGDYISIHQIDEKPLIIVIKNKDVANSYRNLFEFLWKQAKE